MRAKWLLRAVPVIAGVLLAASSHLAEAAQYQIKDGDTLSQLADRLGVSVQALASANGISNPDLIIAGQMLVVPDDGRYGTEYLVKAGDTLAGISGSTGIPMRDIMKANGLDDANVVPAGKLLSIPPVGATVNGPITVGGGGSHTVKLGENLSDIASYLGTSISALAAANGISDPNLITPGQVLSTPNAWLCPVPSATFSNDYGYVHDDGSKHNGVDLFAAKGSPIQAPVSGRLEKYPNPAGGNAFELYGNDGNRYYGAHLSEYGATGNVSAGEIIGYVGNTGDASTTSTHLHFEIHPGGGNAINPYPTLVAACR